MFFEINLIVFIVNLIISPIGAIILLKQWYSSERKFFTDMPFLLGLTFIMVFIDNTDSTLGFIFNYPQNMISGGICATDMIIMTSSLMLITLELWLMEKYKKSRQIIVMSIATFLEITAIITILFRQSDLYLAAVTFLLLIPTTIFLSFTFIQCYQQQRLGNINPLYVGIGFSIFTISVVIKTIMYALFVPISYVFPSWIFIPYIFDIVAYLFVIWGVTHSTKYEKFD